MSNVTPYVKVNRVVSKNTNELKTRTPPISSLVGGDAVRRLMETKSERGRGRGLAYSVTCLTAWRCCTARSKLLTSLCRLQSHPAQYVSGIPSAAILLSISHPIRCSTRCLANVRARISGPMIAL